MKKNCKWTTRHFSQKDSKRIAKEQVMYRVGDDFEEIVNREDDIQLFPGVGKEAARRHVRRSDSAEALHQAGFEDEFLSDEEIEIDLTQPWHLDEDNTEEAFSSPMQRTKIYARRSRRRRTSQR